MLLEFRSGSHQNLSQNVSVMLSDHRILSKTIDSTLSSGCLALCSLRGTRNDTNSQSSGGRLRLRLCRRSKMRTLGCFAQTLGCFVQSVKYRPR